MCIRDSHLNCLPESPPQGASLFRSTLTMKYPMELHPGSGRRASVDFCVILTDRHGQIVGRRPGEAKICIELKNVTQLCVYTWKSCAMDARLGVGFLVDTDSYRIAFTPYNFNNQLVPLSFIYPNIPWRLTSISETAVSSGITTVVNNNPYQHSCLNSTCRSLHSST